MRLPREKRRGQTATYHCMSRTVGGQFLFSSPEKEAFRYRLRKLACFCRIQVRTYTTLSNHFHIVVCVPAEVCLSDEQLLRALSQFYGAKHPKAAEFAQLMRLPDAPLLAHRRASYLARMGDLSVFMKELKEGFSKWFNALHNRFGTLWAERFRSVILPMAAEVILIVSAYVDLNAVRAGMVKDPAHYPFCGYAEALGREGPAREGLASLLPGRSWEEKARCYRNFLYGQGLQAEKSGERILDSAKAWANLQATGKVSLAEALLLKVRPLCEGIALGSEAFVTEIFREFRQKHCRRRTRTAWPLEGADWGRLMCLKRIKDSILKPIMQQHG